jgi:hypothetical protein
MGRTRKTLVAAALGQEIEYQTAGGYTVAGVVMSTNAEENFPCTVVAVGYSWKSVTRRTRAISRQVRSGISKSDEHWVMEVTGLIEATAPVVRDYFGTHKVYAAAVYRPQDGWEAGLRLSAGRSDLRRMAAEGITAVALTFAGRTADFQVTELLRSMNAYRAAA